MICFYRQAIRAIWPLRHFDRVRGVLRALIGAGRDVTKTIQTNNKNTGTSL